MKKIKNRLFRISILALAVISAYSFLAPRFLESSTAYAVGDLTVDWGVSEGSPIFTVTNFAPGETEERTVEVINNATESRPVGVRALKTAPLADTLSEKLNITISQGASDLYGGSLGNKTLAHFFTDSASPDGIFLSNANPGATNTYDFTVVFDPSADNSVIGQIVVFDIKIGISVHIPEECQDIIFDKIIYGTQNDDNISGGNGNNLIFGFEGNDTINGGNSSDCIIGGIGNDNLSGGNSGDVIIDMDGNNTVNGGNGNDIITTGDGNDNISGGNGNDVINAGGGNNNVDGEGGDDPITTGSGTDSIKAGNGNDNVNSGGGNDNIDGNNGNDLLIIDPGSGSINGGNGTDICRSLAKTHCEL